MSKVDCFYAGWMLGVAFEATVLGRPGIGGVVAGVFVGYWLVRLALRGLCAGDSR